MVAEDYALIRSDYHLRAQQACQVADRAPCECPALIPKKAALEVVFSHLLNGADPFIPPVLDAPEVNFQFPPALLLGELWLLS